ncbi:hypothetical protein NLG97_g7208 [Lecanicillium saksenae]|uniref:Uncharacterized protein n=1 Tax=Lecanicillium saksenae TaxID=468837 RepID=A0ACC1QP50_9HYPO|nr:hypothetical protein NLG97_g7208 [Lecanicillium saksenae]
MGAVLVCTVRRPAFVGCRRLELRGSRSIDCFQSARLGFECDSPGTSLAPTLPGSPASRNLASNGGLIDEVIWLRRTEDEQDVAFLQKLLDSEPRYSKRDVDRTEASGFASAYEDMDDDALYVKIDDDVVFIDDNVILSLICSKLTHPEYYIVSANVVNQPMISWLHWNLGAVLPYLPDTKHPYPEVKSGEQIDWRASSLPDYDGPQDADFLDWSSPEQKKHRWLPLRAGRATWRFNSPAVCLKRLCRKACWL